MYNYESIRHVHLEISTRCNATCPLCPRNMFGVEIIDDYPIHDMRLEEAKRIFNSDFLKQLTRIDINGNLGDFVTAKDGVEIVRYFKSINPLLRVQISTNGSAKPNIWEELAKIGARVTFDLDGLKDTHYLYRQNTDWEMIISNAKKFISAGGIATWKMILFDHNKHQVEECERLSKDLGFSEFKLITHGRDSGPVYNKERKLTHIIGTPREPLTFNKLYVGKMSFRKDVTDNPIEFYNTKPITKISCQSKFSNSIYITATGEVYPCCWTGFYPDQMFHEGNEQIKKIKGRNNALDSGIKDAMSWFNNLQDAWSKKSYEDGSLYICNNTCGSS